MEDHMIANKICLNIREAAILTGIGEEMLRRYVRSGELKALYKGKTREVLIPTEILKSFILNAASAGMRLE